MNRAAAPRADLAGTARAEDVLLARLVAWADEGGDPAAPSRLPSWSVGHVLTHLARNADGLRHMVEGSARGDVWAQYPSAETRNADIEAGAQRPAGELVADVERSGGQLRTAWQTAEWTGRGLTLMGPIGVVEVPRRRWREVEVHHVDLGLGYEPADWSPDFVRPELRRQEMIAKSRLPMGMTTWSAAVLALPDHVRLAWLLGRHRADGLGDPGPWR